MIDYKVLINKMVDSHQIVELLGYGGMGAVYKAYDHQFKRWVGLKIINPRLLTQPDLIQQFKTEADAATGLNHYNIAQLYYIGNFQNIPYYTMEFIEGKSFADILKERGRIAGHSCMNYLYQICNGLEYCQFNGILHRDIKPANLMISNDGIVKVVDFGLAMILQEGSRFQEAEQILGTPKYISPEAGTTKILDHRSDIYSLGATFYHLMAGEPAFDADTPLNLLQKHIEEQLLPLHRRNPVVPELVSDIISKMMAKNPKNRYQSYKDLKDDIESAKALGFKKKKDSKIGVSVSAPEKKEKEKKKFPLLITLIISGLVIFGVLLIMIAGGNKNREEETGVSVTQNKDDLDFDNIKIKRDSRNNPGSHPRDGASSGGGPWSRGMRGIDDAEKVKTISTMKQIWVMAAQYQAEHGKWPDTIETLKNKFGAHSVPLSDSWGNRFQLIENSGGGISIVSPGPDSVWDTGDDIEIIDGDVRRN